MPSASQFRAYLQLTKPTIIALVAITGLGTMVAEGSIFHEPLKMSLVLIAIILSAASANAINQFIDRDIDSVMDRTRSKRPLPLHSIAPVSALSFALLLGIVSNAFLWIKINPLSAIISVATILFYVFIYTLWLKRRHHYNIVIGGAAGATAPLIASAAGTNDLSALSWILFGIIFTWTPPHFWALALALKDQYEKVRIPMLPNVLGDERTRLEIVLYTLILLPLGLIPCFMENAGILYAILSIALWLWYMRETVVQLKKQTVSAYRRLFFVSIGYLFFLFLGLMLDGLWRWLRGEI